MQTPLQQTYFQRNRTWIQPIGQLWASPNTLLGLILGFMGSNSWQIYRHNIEIQMTTGPVLASCRRLGISAFTLGDCVLYAAEPCRNLREHEGRHSVQYWLLGPFFLPVYFLLLALRGYYNHPLEKDARLWELKICGSLYHDPVAQQYRG